MPNKVCMHCLVSGKVQGVWFRANTREKARQLGLTGWVKNLPEGRVEVLACGSQENIKQLYQWLHRGPALARVHEVSYEELPWQEHADFVVA